MRLRVRLLATAPRLLRAVVAWVLLFFVMVEGSWLINGVYLSHEWMSAPIFRQWSDELAHYRYLRLAQLFFCAGAVWMYTRASGLARRHWFPSGAAFGLGLACITYIPTYLIDYTTLPVPGRTVFKAILLFTVLLVIQGLIVAWLYRNEQRPDRELRGTTHQW
jgi:hypothetical protein